MVMWALLPDTIPLIYQRRVTAKTRVNSPRTICLGQQEKGFGTTERLVGDGTWQTIQIKIIARAIDAVRQNSSPGTTIVLSATAFSTIANSTATKINRVPTAFSLELDLHAAYLLKQSGSMSKPQQSLGVQWLLLFFALAELLPFSHGDVGTASRYHPPYLPTACYGEDASQFPENNLFGAAGEGIWDNGASCGRRYLVSCLSAEKKGTCVVGQTIQIKIVARAIDAVRQASSPGTTIVLSATAFSTIANATATKINIEFQQV